MEEELTFDLKGIFQALKQHVLIIAIAAVICGAAGFGYSNFLITPQYQASAMMIINNSKGTVGDTLSSSDITAAKNLADMYSIIIKSDAVLQPVIDKIHLTITSENLARKISVNAVDSTQIIRITIRDASPELAKQVIAEITNVIPDIIVDKVEASSCKIISEAKVTSSPVYPNVKKMTLLGFAGGLALAVLFFVLREVLDDTIRSDEQLAEITGVPNLGIIYKRLTPDNTVNPNEKKK